MPGLAASVSVTNGPLTVQLLLVRLGDGHDGDGLLPGLARLELPLLLMLGHLVVSGLALLSGDIGDILLFLLGEPSKEFPYKPPKPSFLPPLKMMLELESLDAGIPSNFNTRAFTFVLLIKVQSLVVFISVFRCKFCIVLGSISAYFFSSAPCSSPV